MISVFCHSFFPVITLSFSFSRRYYKTFSLAEWYTWRLPSAAESSWLIILSSRWHGDRQMDTVNNPHKSWWSTYRRVLRVWNVQETRIVMSSSEMHISANSECPVYKTVLRVSYLLRDWLGSDLRIGHFRFRCPLFNTPQLNTQLTSTTELLNCLRMTTHGWIVK
jgi:hypothetical protein